MSFTKSVANTFITRGLISFIGIFTGIIKARWLGVEGVGTIAILQLALSISLRFFNFGIGSSLAFYGARGEISMKKSLKLIKDTALLLSLISIILLVIFKNIPPSPWLEVSWMHFYLVLTCIPLFFLQNYMQRSLSSKLLIKEMNFSDALATIANLASLVIFVIILDLKITGAICAVFFSLVASNVYLLIIIRKQINNEKGMQFGVTPLKKMIAYGFWNYSLMLVNYIIEQLPLFILKYLSKGFVAVGLFSNAKSLEQKTRLAINPVSQLIFPYTAATSAENSTTRTNQLTRIALILMAFLIGGISIIIKDVIHLMYGADFIPAAKVFYAMTLGMILYPISQFHVVHIAASGDAKKIFLYNLYILIPSIPFMYLLVKSYGMVGAGLCYSLVQILNFIIRLRIYKSSTKSTLKEIFLPGKADLDLVKKLISELILYLHKLLKKYFCREV